MHACMQAWGGLFALRATKGRAAGQLKRASYLSTLGQVPLPRM